ncbi:MAG: JAB domain-containing protein [Gammaproteobacteria bacterium]
MTHRDKRKPRLDETSAFYDPGSLGDDAILIRAAAILEARCVREGDLLSNPTDARRAVQLRTATLEHEIFGLVYLDNRHRVLGFEDLFRGTIDGCTVHPREVAKAALRMNAAAVLIYHNHPSTDPTPSRADELLTQRLKEVLSLLDIRVIDHIVIGGTEVVSFAERGLL